MGCSAKIRHRRRRRDLARAAQVQSIEQALDRALEDLAAMARRRPADFAGKADFVKVVPCSHLRRATGAVKGAPADAVADCEALYDGDGRETR